MSQSRSQIWACRTASGYVVRVEGHGTMRESHALKEFAHGSLGDEVLPLTVDLSACKFLDSTFLGCLVGLHKRFQEARPGSFRVVADTEKVTSLLQPTQVDRFLPITDTSEEEIVGQCVAITSAVSDPADLGHHIMECHRLLADIDGPQQSAFRRIADRLASELQGG